MCVETDIFALLTAMIMNVFSVSDFDRRVSVNFLPLDQLLAQSCNTRTTLALKLVSEAQARLANPSSQAGRRAVTGGQQVTGLPLRQS